MTQFSSQFKKSTQNISERKKKKKKEVNTYFKYIMFHQFNIKKKEYI